MAKSLFLFPSAKIAVLATEKEMTNICIAIEQEILSKYDGEYSIGFEVFPARIDDYTCLGDRLFNNVHIHVEKVK